MSDLKTVNIKGKNYVEVNERIKYFRGQPAYAGWSLRTEIIELDKDRCVMKAVILNKDEIIMAEGCAYEMAGSSFINKTSYIENCETSAWGRALGNLGIGIDTSVASSNEVLNAISQQNTTTKPKVVEAPAKPVPVDTTKTPEGRYSKTKGGANVEYKKEHSLSSDTMKRVKGLNRDGKKGGDVLKLYLPKYNEANKTSLSAQDLKTDDLVNSVIDFIDNSAPSDL